MGVEQMEKLLEIENLSVTFGAKEHSAKVIENLNFFLNKGETLGVVGESGSGKSVTSLAVMRLLAENNSTVTGRILFDGTDLTKLSEKEMQQVRGNKIAMIFQEPMTSLNPILPCGKQIMEPILLHTKLGKEEAKKRALALLSLCGIPDPAQRFHEYPHQMSGGMRQRIMIAIALACDPELLIADEPTTALDVTVQAQIMELMKDLKQKIHMSILLITHDLGVVCDSCDRVVIMYAGQIVEAAPVRALFQNPLHPYAAGLLDAIPRLNVPKERLEAIDGMVPDVDKMPPGCRFHPRCKRAFDRCKNEAPALREMEGGRAVRCFLYDKEQEEAAE